MSFLKSPRLLMAVRICQLLFALGLVVLLGFSNSNPGYWWNLQGPVALGVVSFLFTLVIGGHHVWEHFRHSEHFRTGITRIVRIVFEGIMVLMWAGTVALMIRSPQQNFNVSPFDLPPTTEWTLGEIFTFVEIALFIVTTALLSLRSNTSSYPTGAGTSYV